MPATRMHAQERREQLLDATKAIVARRGFHAISIEAVAREAGITRPIVYGHFHDLPGLLEALIERETARALAQLVTILPGDLASGDPREGMLASLRGYLEAVRADPGTWRLVLMPPEGAPPILHDHIARGRAAVVEHLALAVGPGLGSGRASPDPELFARTLSAISDEGARLLLTDPEQYPVERIVTFARWLMEELSPVSGFDPARLERIQAHFDRYVEDGRLPGWLVVIARDGEVVHRALSGLRDVEADAPVEPDTLWRVYSMTKPITSVAAMMLWEEGHFELKDPIARFLPEFAEPRVFAGGAMAKVATVPATEPIRMWHLLTHTSGLTYGFHHHGAVDEIYRAEGFEWGTPPGMDLAACCEAWARLPLLFQPGSEWNYGVSTDVLGRVIEVISGQPLDEFLAARVLGPLGMVETGFCAAESDHGRLAALYTPDPETGRATRSPMSVAATRRPDCLSGGGGLVSSADDYARFTRMLLGRGEVDGVRLLGTRTLRLMASNQLPGHVDLEAFGRPLFAETTFDGVGFGLGFSVVEDPIAPRYPTSRGEFGWGGAASTVFWVDPVERLEVLFFTQLLPSSTHPIRSQLHQLVHQALVD